MPVRWNKWDAEWSYETLREKAINGNCDKDEMCSCVPISSRFGSSAAGSLRSPDAL